MTFIKPFFFGILASLGALFLELILGVFFFVPEEIKNIFFSQLTPLLILTIAIEEIFKFIFIYRSCQEDRNDSETKIFHKALIIGLGFSCVELSFIFFNLPAEQNIFSLALGILGIAITHVAAAGTIGYLMAKAGVINVVFIIRTLLAASALHLAYNSLIIYEAGPLAITLYLFSLILLLVLLARKASGKSAQPVKI